MSIENSLRLAQVLHSTVAIAPPAKRIQPTRVSSASMGCTKVSITAETATGSPSSESKASIW